MCYVEEKTFKPLCIKIDSNFFEQCDNSPRVADKPCNMPRVTDAVDVKYPI